MGGWEDIIDFVECDLLHAGIFYQGHSIVGQLLPSGLAVNPNVLKDLSI